MQSLRVYLLEVCKVLISTCSLVKEELGLQDIWTDRWMDRVSPIYS